MSSIKEEHFRVPEANALIVIAMLLFLTVGAALQVRALLTGLLFTQYVLLAGPVLLYAVLRKKNLRAVFRLRTIPWTEAARVILMAVLLVPTVLTANLLVLSALSAFGKVIEQSLPVADSLGSFLWLFFVMAVTPGICEEILFRGMVLDAYENRLGRKQGAIASALLFALFHFNPQNIAGPLILGLFFAYLVQLTGSLVPAILAHLTNNGVSVIMGYLGTVMTSPELAEMDPEMVLASGPLFMAALGFSVLAGLGLLGFFHQMKALRRSRSLFAPDRILRLRGTPYRIVAVRSDHLLLVEEAVDGRSLDAETTMDQIKALALGHLKKMPFVYEGEGLWEGKQPRSFFSWFFVVSFFAIYLVIVQWQWQMLGL